MTFSDRKCTRLAAFAASLLLVGTTAFAQMGGSMQQPAPQSRTDATQPAQATGDTSAGDRVFVETALKGGLAEVQLGQVALQKSNNEDVKQFAQKMIDDHGQMNDHLKTVGQAIEVKLPDGPSKKDKANIAKLSALSGDDFDKAYMKDMVKDHKTDLSDFQTEAQAGSNPAVKSFASQGAQIISQHLQMAQQISQKENSTASTSMTK
jgi:putative membrane protein